MINATPSLPTASSQPPKDPTFGAKPAPMAMKPKAKTNWRMILGLGVLLLVIVGGAAGFYLTQMGGLDVRQQAAVTNPCSDIAATCLVGSASCPAGQNKVGTCSDRGEQGSCCKQPGGTVACADSAATCNVGATSCPSGQLRTGSCSDRGDQGSCCKPANVSQPCSDSTATCTLGACGSGQVSVGSCSDRGEQGSCCKTAPSCYDLNQGCIRITSAECSNGVGAGKYTDLAQCQAARCTPQQLVAINCPTGEEPYCNNGTPACRLSASTNPNPVALQGCNQACNSSAYCTCPAGCAVQTQISIGQNCGGNTTPTLTACNQTCNSQAGCNCPSGCAQSFAQNGGTCGGNTTPTLTSCTQTCTAQAGCNCPSGCSRTFANNGQTCGSAGTGGTITYCPNSPTTPARRYVKFTCPNGCQLTTEQGVTAWRCYERRQDSTTPLTLNGECGQVDVLSGDTDATYCGYTEYTCDQARCQPQQTPPPSTPPAQASCVRLELLDETGSTVLNQTPASGNVRFRCVGAPGSNYYFFTARSNQTGPLNLIYQGDSSMTFPIAITDYLHVQCNPCIGTSCASAENVNTSCNFEYTRQIPPGPQCLALWMASTENPTVSLTNPHVGDSILLGCGQVQGAARYVFRVTEPDGNVVNLQPLDVTAAPRTSQAYTITKQGRHYAQCQICTGQADSTCFAYETLPSN